MICRKSGGRSISAAMISNGGRLLGVNNTEINMAGYFSQLESLYSSLDIQDNDEDGDFFNLVVSEMESDDLVRVFMCDSCGKTLKIVRGFTSHVPRHEEQQEIIIRFGVQKR